MSKDFPIARKIHQTQPQPQGKKVCLRSMQQIVHIQLPTRNPQKDLPSQGAHFPVRLMREKFRGKRVFKIAQRNPLQELQILLRRLQYRILQTGSIPAAHRHRAQGRSVPLRTLR